MAYRYRDRGGSSFADTPGHAHAQHGDGAPTPTWPSCWSTRRTAQRSRRVSLAHRAASASPTSVLAVNKIDLVSRGRVRRHLRRPADVLGDAARVQAERAHGDNVITPSDRTPGIPVRRLALPESRSTRRPGMRAARSASRAAGPPDAGSGYAGQIASAPSGRRSHHRLASGVTTRDADRHGMATEAAVAPDR